MDIVTKDFPVTAGEATDAYPHGAFEVVLSAPTLDRDGEVIDSRAFDPLPAHIPFDVDHSMTVTGTVGSGVPYYDESGNLRVKGTFASTPLGQEVRTDPCGQPGPSSCLVRPPELGRQPGQHVELQPQEGGQIGGLDDAIGVEHGAVVPAAVVAVVIGR